MQRSEDRILTTHAGALDLPAGLPELLLADRLGELPDPAALQQRLTSGVAEIVETQVQAGIDIVNDGEISKSSWSRYIAERVTGLELQVRNDELPQAVTGSKDRHDFPQFYSELGGHMWYPGTGAELELRNLVQPLLPVCTGPIAYRGYDDVRRDIANLKAAIAGTDVTDAFLPVVAPGSVQPVVRDEYYGDPEALFSALADALKEEYRAIIDAGFICQIDDAFLPAEWDRRMLEPGWNLQKFREWADLAVAALNQAIEGLPEDRIRYHVCWGSWNGPHANDIPLNDLVDLILKVNAQGYVLEAANARHEWEYHVWEDVKLPDGKILIPGVIEHTTNVVEHPRTVADRIVRFANVVGRENVIAGTDCGLRSRVHPEIGAAKLKALGEGARLASEQLWR